MRLTYILSWAITVLLFSLLFTPLIVSNSLLFPFIAGKAFFFRIVIEVALALWLILIWLKPECRPRKSGLLVGLGSLVLFAALATVFGVDPYVSFWSSFERMEGLIGYLHLLAFFLVLGSFLNSELSWRRFFQVSVGVSVILGAYGLLQLTGQLAIHQGTVRLDATLGNAVYLAIFMQIHFFITAWLAIKDWAIKWRRYVYGLIMILQVIILYYTATRGAILGLIGGILVALILLTIFGKKGALTRKFAAIGLIAVAVLSGSFFLVKESSFIQGSPVLSRFAAISLTERTTESRLTIWQMTLRSFVEKPVLGWGPGNFPVVFNKYYEPKLWRQELWFDRSHNIFLDWMVNAGALGLLSYLSLFIAALYYLWRRSGRFSIIESTIFTGLLAAYFFHNIFVFDNLTSYLPFLSLLAYIHFRSFGTRSKLNEQDTVVSRAVPSRSFYLQVFALILVVATASSIYVVNIKPILAARTLIHALSESDVDRGVALFEQALGHNTFVNREIRDQILNLASQVVADERAPVAVKDKIAGLTIDELRKQVDKSPADVRSHLFLGSFLLQVGLVDEAVIELEEVRELAPRKQQVIFALARALNARGDIDESLNLARLAYELDDSYPVARSLYVNMLVEAERYEPLPRLWQEQVESDPTNSDSWLSWAASEFVLGRKAEALAILAEAKSRFPDGAAQIEVIIKEIRAGHNPIVQ
ncbi:MAG: O-antigen ligase family protein [Patescibacteria group bacterium]|nr:O-antigen ligase family protein [Patescibacteria group bacterium]